MAKKVFITIDKNKLGIDRLNAIPGIELIFSELHGDSNNYEVPKKIAGEINILFCELPPKNIGVMTNLEFIQISSTGYSQLFKLGLAEKSIKACNGRGEFDTPIAEWAISMIVNLNRDLRTMIRNQEEGIWERPAKFQTELRGKTLGLFGYGSLARETARLAKCMGMIIHAYGRERVDFTSRNYYMLPGTGDPKCELPEQFFYPGEEKKFMSGLDFLVVAMPLTNVTKGIITEEYLRALPRGAYVLNFARGPLIREDALLAVLRDGHLGGAALDAHYYYPMPADHPLWKFPNVIMTPHISGSSLSTNFLPRIYDIFSQNVERFMNGQPLINELTPFQLAGN
jgi:phosphoglycerate dehydrogenase-like enzyme